MAQSTKSWAPGRHEALVGLGEGEFVIVDGTLIPTDRIKADEPYYAQKHKQHGMTVQVVARPDGTPLWFSRATPGRTHDLTAARAHGIVQAGLTQQILVLADRAYQGAGSTFRTPTTTTANSPSTASSSTATTPASEHPANAPSPNSRPGDCFDGPEAPPAASAPSSKPSAHS